MSTDIYGDETPTPPETTFTLGNRGDELGVWVTTTVNDDRVFIPLRELKDIEYALGAVRDAAAALRNVGIGLSAIPNRGAQFLDSGCEDLDGTGNLCDRLIGLVTLEEPTPFDRLLGGALSTADSFVDAHDSSPSVGDKPSGGSACGCSGSNPTEGEAVRAATNAEAAATRAEVAALYAVDAGNTAAWAAAGGRVERPKPVAKPTGADTADRVVINEMTIANPEEFVRAIDERHRRIEKLRGQ